MGFKGDTKQVQEKKGYDIVQRMYIEGNNQK
jgi:hypothetical protein